MHACRHRAAALLAALAMAFHAAWPLVAQAMPAGTFEDVCTIEGVKSIRVAGGEKSGGDHDVKKHCALCVAGSSPAIAAKSFAVPAVGGGLDRSAAASVAPLPRFPHSFARSRAPPAVS